MNVVSGKKPGRAAVAFLAALVFFFWGEAYAGAGLPAKYNPVRIAKGIKRAYVGSVAWSPDGTRVAYIGKRVEIHHVASGKARSLELDGAYFLAWASEGELLVLFHEEEGVSLGWVDAESLGMNKAALPVKADMAYPLGDRKLLLAVSEAKRISIGLDLRHGLYLYDLKDGSLGEVYSSGRVLPRRKKKEERHRGWLDAGPNPLGGEMILLEEVDPPALEPYLKICTVDYATGRKSEISRVQRGRFHISGSWSPSGRRAAVVDEDGRMRILELDGGLLAVDNGIAGKRPSWNPSGSQIFFGGYLLRSDGGEREEIVPGGDGESMAFWSPEGSSMALLIDEKLWLLSGFAPSYVSPDTPPDEALKGKIRILRELLAEDLLTEGEYYERYNGIIQRHVLSRER